MARFADFFDKYSKGFGPNPRDDDKPTIAELEAMQQTEIADREAEMINKPAIKPRAGGVTAQEMEQMVPIKAPIGELRKFEQTQQEDADKKPSSSDRLKSAAEKRDKSIRNMMIVEGLAKIAGSFAGAPVKTDLSRMGDVAQQQYADVESAITRESAEAKDARELQREQNLRDPNSELSARYQALATEVTGQDFSGKSAEDIQRFLPIITQQKQFREGLDQRERLARIKQSSGRQMNPYQLGRLMEMAQNREFRREQKLDKDIERISTRLEKQGLPTRQRAMNEIEDFIALKGGNLDKGLKPKEGIAGVGFMGGLAPDIALPQDDVNFRQNVQSLANQLLKSRSGAAVTDQEYARFLREAGSGNFSGEADLVEGLRKMKADIQLQMRNIIQSADPAAQRAFTKRTGIRVGRAKDRKEGETWEEGGYQYKMENGRIFEREIK